MQHRRSVAGASRPRPGGERDETFVVRIALAAGGRPVRTTVTHVGTQTEQPLVGWSPAAVVRLIESQARLSRAPGPAADPAPVPPPPLPAQHLVVLDAGRAIGGGRRTIELAVETSRMGDPVSFRYRATLAGRSYGQAGDDAGWTPLATDAGRGRPPARLPLRFEAVELPAGLQRLRLELAVAPARPRAQAPPLTLASPAPVTDG
jgi:hypothetical protein